MNSSVCQSVDVLVIGAGPSGLFAAQALARLGISTKVIDRRSSGSLYGNADGLQPRTQEIWQSYGLLDYYSKKSAAVNAVVTYKWDAGCTTFIRGESMRNITSVTRYPYALTAGIERIEGTLRESLESTGTYVEYCRVPVSLTVEQGDACSVSEVSAEYPVKVLLQETPEDSSVDHGGDVVTPIQQTVLAKYVIGADGAHSWVRQQCGIEMEGDQTEFIWGVVDAKIDTDFPDCRFKCIIKSAGGSIIIIPHEEEKIRIYVKLTPDNYPRTVNGRLDRSKVKSDVVRRRLLKTISENLSPFKITFTSVLWHTIFSVPQRIAASYCFQERVFIVGDACHTHSPTAGQGANASMGDAHNLAWKLAYVLRGWAGTHLLKTYETERRSYARDLISFDKQISKLLSDDHVVEYQSLIHAQNEFTTGIGVFYDSNLTVSDDIHRHNLLSGRRLPPSPICRLADWQTMDLQDLIPADGLFKLLVLPGDVHRMKSHDRLLQVSAFLSGETWFTERKRIMTYVILNNTKETTHWTAVPLVLREWQKVFVSNSVYTTLNITADGTLLLIRLDGYISMITKFSLKSAETVVHVLSSIMQ